MEGKKKQKKAHWAKAHVQAANCGIVLTRRQTRSGEYVCYLSKKARKSLFWGL